MLAALEAITEDVERGMLATSPPTLGLGRFACGRSRGIVHYHDA